MTSESPIWGHGVVIGAGIAGLLTARVLADHFQQVTVLEQDTLTLYTSYRKGVPQARHPHALLARGADILEELFPGLRAELDEAGAPTVDMGEALSLMLPTGCAPREALGISVQTITRVGLEGRLRRRVMAHERITIRSGVRVENLCWQGASASRVTGVRINQRSQPLAEPALVEADLVVDTSGRTSKLRAWLAEAGYPTPDVRTVDGRVSYTSRLYRIPPDLARDWELVGELTHAPVVRHGGVLTPVEGGRWLISLIGAAGERAPADEAGFAAYARGLRTPHIAAGIAAAEPIGPLHQRVGLKNQWTLYHKMRRWPDRLLCLGDAVCVLNPIHGQGMTVAAIEARSLAALLDRQRRTPTLTGLASRFQREVASILRVPWLTASTGDLLWSTQRPPAYALVANAYLAQLLKLVPGDSDIYRRFMATAHMLASPATLAHPAILARAALAAGRRGNTAPDQVDSVAG